MSAQAATLTVNTSLDHDGSGCTLREAIESINRAQPEAGCNNTGDAFGNNDTINISLPGVHTIALQQGQLKFAEGKDVTITGSGRDNLKIDAGKNSRVFFLQGSILSLNDLTISGGLASSGGGIFVSGKGSMVSLTNSTVSKNSTPFFGGRQSTGNICTALNGQQLYILMWRHSW